MYKIQLVQNQTLIRKDYPKVKFGAVELAELAAEVQRLVPVVNPYLLHYEAVGTLASQTSLYMELVVIALMFSI